MRGRPRQNRPDSWWVRPNRLIASKENQTMVNYDLSPLFRTTVGFDRLMDMVENGLTAAKQDTGYPPYNIEKVGEDQYRIQLAVAGFSRDDLDIVFEGNHLTVAGRVADRPEEAPHYLHRGIARRAFRHRFELADNVRVVGADLSNGLLSVELKREIPEELKPRRIEIGAAAKPGIANAA
jgi:molecular chaperone IbpA